jgi:hypothetical protein
MTLAISTDTRVTEQVEQTPPIGSLLYLASYLLRLKLSAEVTPPDTPDMYSGDLEVQGDAGDMELAKLRGPRGFAGRAQFPLRRQDEPIVNSAEELPTDLTNTTEDIGKYWEIDILNFEGTVVDRECHTWFGNRWRVLHMGTVGAPGEVPDIQISTDLLEPQAAPTYPDRTSFVDTSGNRLQPSWRINLAVPRGIPGVVKPLALMPDVDVGGPGAYTPVAGDVFACSGSHTSGGADIWKPMGLGQFSTQFFSVPEAAFTAYDGDDQRVLIGSFTIPAQPFRYTPIAWGHLGSGGLHLSARPLMIGVEVRLGDPELGRLVARGLGNALGEVNIMPHYSSSRNQAASITPENNRAIVSEGDTAVINVSLYNEGQLGIYHFEPQSAQLFVLVQPMYRNQRIEPFMTEVVTA